MCLIRLGLTSLAIQLASAANGQWTVVDLHPAGALDSRAWGVGMGVQVGTVLSGGYYRASTWTGSSQSWSPLNGVTADVHDTDGHQIVGVLSSRATVWSVATGNVTDLHPTGATNSYATSVWMNEQGGYAVFNGNAHAGTWSGDSNSWTDLHPTSGWSSSTVFGVHLGTQAGVVSLTDVTSHAALWHGSPKSLVDLHPTGANGSFATAVYDDQQVGYAFVNQMQHASLWSGTASSWIDLNPTGSPRSWAFDVSSGYQVGAAKIGDDLNGNYHASIWRGSAGSWVDLHAMLPSTFDTSEAHGIYVNANQIAVVGFGFTSGGGHALLWTAPVPELSGAVALLVLTLLAVVRLRTAR